MSARVIKPGYYLHGKSADGSKHIVNICQSKAVENSKDFVTIPTLMSDKRHVIQGNLNLTRK